MHADTHTTTRIKYRVLRRSTARRASAGVRSQRCAAHRRDRLDGGFLMMSFAPSEKPLVAGISFPFMY
eukprot:6916273-Prymnesium_polylepis.1